MLSEKSIGDQKIAVVNASVIHPMPHWPILSSLLAFSHLHVWKWAQWINHLPTFAQDPTRHFIAVIYLPWVGFRYSLGDMQKNIKNYKFHGLSNEGFLAALSKEFSFLQEIKYDRATQEDIFSHKDDYLALKGKEVKRSDDLEPSDIAQVLIEKAWSEPRILPFDKKHKDRINRLLKEFSTIILVSNTNPMDIYWLVKWLSKSLPGNNIAEPQVLNAYQVPDDKEISVKNQFVDINPENSQQKILLALSYRFKMEKTTGLIHLVSDEYKNNLCNLHFISQWPADLKEAESILKANGIEEKSRVTLANTFFKDKSASHFPVREVVCGVAIALLAAKYSTSLSWIMLGGFAFYAATKVLKYSVESVGESATINRTLR